MGTRKKNPAFDYSLDYENLDLSKHPELYRIGIGEQGVLLVQPYKNEILPHWRFKTPKEAKISSRQIYAMFRRYLANNDFVGADMARKFLQMGWTRARRYSNRKGGRKYDPVSGKELPRNIDAEKAESAAIFYDRYVAARENSKYKTMKSEHLRNNSD